MPGFYSLDVGSDVRKDLVGKTILTAQQVEDVVAYLASPAAERITGQVFVVYGGMVALLAAPVVEQRFDASGDTWDLPDLDKQLGGFFADRDPSVGFAADAVMNVADQPLS